MVPKTSGGWGKTAADPRSDLRERPLRRSRLLFWSPSAVFFCFPVFTFTCHVDSEHAQASAASGRGTMNSRWPEPWYVLPPFLPSPALSVLCSFFPPLHLCCWLGSVLGSTCPQNEYTFACIRTLPWLCLPPAAPSSLINDLSAPLLARPLSR